MKLFMSSCKTRLLCLTWMYSLSNSIYQHHCRTFSFDLVSIISSFCIFSKSPQHRIVICVVASYIFIVLWWKLGAWWWWWFFLKFILLYACLSNVHKTWLWRNVSTFFMKFGHQYYVLFHRISNLKICQYIGWSDVTYLWSQCDRHFVGQHVVLCVVKWWRSHYSNQIESVDLRKCP